MIGEIGQSLTERLARKAWGWHGLQQGSHLGPVCGRAARGRSSVLRTAVLPSLAWMFCSSQGMAQRHRVVRRAGRVPSGVPRRGRAQQVWGRAQEWTQQEVTEFLQKGSANSLVFAWERRQVAAGEISSGGKTIKNKQTIVVLNSLCKYLREDYNSHFRASSKQGDYWAGVRRIQIEGLTYWELTVRFLFQICFLAAKNILRNQIIRRDIYFYLWQVKNSPSLTKALPILFLCISC